MMRKRPAASTSSGVASQGAVQTQHRAALHAHQMAVGDANAGPHKRQGAQVAAPGLIRGIQAGHQAQPFFQPGAG